MQIGECRGYVCRLTVAVSELYRVCDAARKYVVLLVENERSILASDTVRCGLCNTIHYLATYFEMLFYAKWSVACQWRGVLFNNHKILLSSKQETVILHMNLIITSCFSHFRII